MSQPLNSDPELQRQIDATVAEMRKVEANYVATMEHLRTRKPDSMDDEIARDRVLARLRQEWHEARRPYVETVQRLASSERRGGVTYLSPITQELAGRIGQVLA